MPKATPNIHGLIAQCHFCDAPKGRVEVDLIELLAQAPSRTSVDINLGDVNGPRMFIFDGDILVPRPCPHTIDLSLSGTIRALYSKRERARYSFYATWKHPWLGRYDRDETLLMFAWDAYDGDADMFRPDAPHVLDRHIRDTYRPRGSPWEVNLEGDLFVAADPLKYFKELRANHRRYEEQEDRQSNEA